MSSIAMIVISMGAMMFMVIILAFIYMMGFKKVPPDMVMVVYGKGTDQRFGYTVVVGGGKFIFPVVQSYRFLPIDVRTLQLSFKDLLVKDFKKDLPVKMVLVSQIRPSPDRKIVHNAVQNLLSKRDKEINEFGEQIIEMHTRRIARNMQIDEINSDRDTFTEKVKNSARKDMNEIGLEIRSLVMKDLDDDVGFFKGLARKKIEQEEARMRREMKEKLPPEPLTENEKRAKAHNEYALSLMDQGFYKRALNYFDKALEVNPNEPAFNLNRERCQQFVDLNET